MPDSARGSQEKRGEGAPCSHGLNKRSFGVMEPGRDQVSPEMSGVRETTVSSPGVLELGKLLFGDIYCLSEARGSAEFGALLTKH